MQIGFHWCSFFMTVFCALSLCCIFAESLPALEKQFGRQLPKGPFPWVTLWAAAHCKYFWNFTYRLSALFQLLLEDFTRSVLIASLVFSQCCFTEIIFKLNSSSTLLFTPASHAYLILIVLLPLCLCFAYLSKPSSLLSVVKSVSMLVQLS